MNAITKDNLEKKYSLVGRCGIFCGTDCEVYKAAHSDDINAKKEVASALERELGVEIDPSRLHCEGCQGPEECMWFECRLCLIRRCGKTQGVIICSECEDYPCRVLQYWLSESQSAPQNLEEIKRIGLDQWIEKKVKPE